MKRLKVIARAVFLFSIVFSLSLGSSVEGWPWRWVKPHVKWDEAADQNHTDANPDRGCARVTVLPESIREQGAPTEYDGWLRVFGNTAGYTKTPDGTKTLRLYPLYVSGISGAGIFYVTRETTAYQWPNSATRGDPYGTDATCPPGDYWGSYDNETDKTRPRIIIADFQNPWKPGNRYLRSPVKNTMREAIQIHALTNTLKGCMGLPNLPGKTINDLIDCLYGTPRPSEAIMASTVLRVEIEPADFTLIAGVGAQFGAIINQMKVNLYPAVDISLQALHLGEVDVVESPLNFEDPIDKTWLDLWSQPNSEVLVWWYNNGLFFKACRIRYTGGNDEVLKSPEDGENQYRGRDWKSFANQYGFGLNSWGTFLNAHVESPPGIPMEGGVLRYGFSASQLTSLNPLYFKSYWDWEILSKVYDTLLKRNALDLGEDLEWVAKRWEVGIWDNAGEPATKLTFELRDDVYWHDGQKLDADDIKFTMVDLVYILDSRGLPPPWCLGRLMDVNGITIINQYKVEIKMNIKSAFALQWIGELPILPEHIWRPIVTTGNPTGFAPDTHIIGCGPYKVGPDHSIDPATNDYYVPAQYVKLDAYKPSSPGFFNYGPIRASKAMHGGYVDAYLQNYHSSAITVTVSATANGIPLTGGGTVTVPKSPGYGNVPGVLVVLFSGLFPPKASYDIAVSVSYTLGKSYSYTLDPPLLGPSIDGDITNDGTVNVFDMIHLAFHFGFKAYIWPEDDINADKQINVLDAIIIQNNFGQTAP